MLMKQFRRIVFFVTALPLVYFMAAGIGALLPTRPAIIDCPTRDTVYLSTNGLHLYYLFPIKHLPDTLLKDLGLIGERYYLAVGWGDRNFYLETPTWAKMRPGPTLRALFLPSEAVLHVAPYQRLPTDARSLHLCPGQVDTLVRYVTQTLAYDSEGSLLEVASTGYSDRDRFFLARGRYSLFFTCNNWINRGLKKAQRRTGRWTPFDWGVLWQLGNTDTS